MSSFKLYTFFQSGSAYRVRIALNLKNLAYEPIFIRGGRNSAALQSVEFLRLNPQGALPALVHDGRVLTQSVSIIEYLDEVHPAQALLPADPAGRQRVRALSHLITSDVHPLISARVIEYLDTTLQLEKPKQDAWLQNWIGKGLHALEKMLATSPDTGIYCHGDTPTIADACLIPQIYTARRFACDLSGFPIINRIEAHCLKHPGFVAAAPENQPDAPQSNAKQ